MSITAVYMTSSETITMYAYAHAICCDTNCMILHHLISLKIRKVVDSVNMFCELGDN